MAAAILATNDDAIGRAARHWRAALSASIPEAPSDD
jgi:5-(carboxyamino)imidazole ribonucleotide mutase